MTLDASLDSVPFASVGIDATDLSPYRHTTTDDGDLLVYDEEHERAWLQSTFWIQAETMR
ncbi:MAG: hypothetical protein ACOC42_01770 [Halobacteriota archaeon]